MIEKIFAKAEPEKIANGSFDAGSGFVVPGHTNDKFFEVKIFWRGDGNPDVSNDARTRNVEEFERSTGGERPVVGIGAGAIKAGDAALEVVVRLSEREKRFRSAGAALGLESCGKKETENNKEVFAHGDLAKRNLVDVPRPERECSTEWAWS